MLYKNYRHCTDIQVRFNDIDSLKHVNNACYLSYCEIGRVNYFHAIFRNHINWIDRGFVLARTEMDHLNPIFLQDKVKCYTRIEKIGTKSITVSNCIVKENKSEIIECANALGILVAMDYKKELSIDVPKEWVALIKTFEIEL
ncbi:MAG: acyl-CoA thioesterase [Sphingobacteriaceae bacterium]|nr:acyl-CoA thioesterase [Sphingobacteriaceae bacterium]